MTRRLTALLLGVALLGPAAGCRSSCGQNRGWFTSNTRGEAPCQLVGSGKPLAEGCYDAVTGQPVPCPPPTQLIPGGGYPGGPGPGGPPNELPYPAPGDMIPRPGVPYAPPAPAPGFEGAGANPKGGGGTPVKAGPKQ